MNPDSSGVRSSGTFSAIPVVDLAAWRGSPDERRALADEVRSVCHEVGFFLVVNHGVDPGFIDTIFEMMRYVFYNSCYSLADIIIGVHPHHARFYKRAFGFEVFGPIKQHPYVRNRPVVLLRGDTKLQISGIPDLLPVLRDYMKHPVPKISFDNRPQLKNDIVAGTSFQELLRPSPSTSENQNHNSSRKED